MLSKPILVPWAERPWPSLPLPPLTPCDASRNGVHDFSRIDPDTLCRCWHCAQLSPRSRLRIEQRAAAAAGAPTP
jgi:hypothetical protein